ncbi:MAG: amidohydrolase [Alphaproteobacteria bacterium PA4]|nr:MAG: amidohydrolase [Alphaproteobacteria bacterium PA4]
MTIQMHRRGFIGTGLAGLAVPAWALDAGEADTIVVNARVHTVDPARPRATAFAVKDGRFMRVGDEAGARALAGKGTRIIDARGMTVVPGFIDCHNHASAEMLLYEVLVGNPFEVEFVSIASIIAKLRAKAATLPPGQWVEGFFHDDTKLSDKRQLTIADLDAVSTEHPVCVHHRGGHTGFYNSRAFALAGVTQATPNPPGGTFDRAADGRLNGRVTDNAMDVFDTVGTRPSFTPAQQVQRARDAAAHMSKAFARYGLTGVHHQGGDLAALQAIRARGELCHRVSFETRGAMLDAMIANGIQTGFGDDWIKLGATFEHTADGSFSERTMAISTPYAGRTPAYYGNVTEEQPVLDAWVERVHRAGIQVNCHANGDVAIDHVLTAFERAQKAFPVADPRFKITHCTLVNADLVRRIKAVGAIPAPFTSYAYYNADKFGFYGEALMQNCMAFRSFLDAGIPVCAGSDFYPGPFAPLMGMQGMVTRTGWNGQTWGANQRVSVAEALRINTLNGAHASREESIKGSISAGKLADYVVLADDPEMVPQDRIKDIRIVETVTGGRTVYSA